MHEGKFKILKWVCLIIVLLNTSQLRSLAGTTSVLVNTPNGLQPLYTSQVDFSSFLVRDYHRQQESEWCWAACVSMVFSFYGHPVSQSNIVASVYGSPINAPASSGAYIVGVLNREWTDDNGKRFRSTVNGVYDFDNHVSDLDNAALVAELDKGNPIVIGAGGHAMVLTSMEYAGSPLFPIPTRCGVFDPLPGKGPRGLNLNELHTMDKGGDFRFAATIKVEDIASDDSTASPVSGTTATVDNNNAGDSGQDATKDISVDSDNPIYDANAQQFDCTLTYQNTNVKAVRVVTKVEVRTGDSFGYDPACNKTLKSVHYNFVVPANGTHKIHVIWPITSHSVCTPTLYYGGDGLDEPGMLKATIED